MPSLRQLLARHPALLLLDASSSRVEVSLWRADAPDAPRARHGIEGEASIALPAAIARVLVSASAAETGDNASPMRIQNLDAVAFCDGPGSVLGIRLAAATVRTWRAVHPALAAYAFHSLPPLAFAHPDLTIVADARRDTWHAVRPGAPHDLLRLPSAELASAGPLGTPADFRQWSALPQGVLPRVLPYSAAALLAAAPDEAFFRPAPEPDAWMTEAPAYVAWTPRIHQAPPAP